MTEIGPASDHRVLPRKRASTLPGNIENFLGVAQVPIGVAGPLRINGEHARGDFYIPLATTEGTLVASYNRGMRVLSESGGVTTTVVGDSMQRAPAFVLPDALRAREFGEWVDAHFDQIRSAAEATTRAGRLTHITQHAVGPIRFLRCNYTTGDAAGQNMTGKATLAACEWIRANYSGELEFVLSGNVETDKKHSAMNTLLTRGKRVVAEATLDQQVLAELMGVKTRTMFHWRQVSNVGALLSGAANNGAHAANGIAALFIATGQDVANVAESHQMASEAEDGLDTSRLHRRPGRPAMGSGPADSFPVRLDPALRSALDHRAATDNTTASDVVREALRRYLTAS
jgi:hydroxymethylglutaryl-CoA reductase (NADPH)